MHGLQIARNVLELFKAPYRHLIYQLSFHAFGQLYFQVLSPSKEALTFYKYLCFDELLQETDCSQRMRSESGQIRSCLENRQTGQIMKITSKNVVLKSSKPVLLPLMADTLLVFTMIVGLLTFKDAMEVAKE